jgi:inactivated superfamily I helicase
MDETALSGLADKLSELSNEIDAETDPVKKLALLEQYKDLSQAYNRELAHGYKRILDYWQQMFKDASERYFEISDKLIQERQMYNSLLLQGMTDKPQQN